MNYWYSSDYDLLSIQLEYELSDLPVQRKKLFSNSVLDNIVFQKAILIPTNNLNTNQYSVNLIFRIL